MNKQLVAAVIAVGSLFWLGGTAPAFSQNKPTSYNTKPIYIGPYGASSGPYPIFTTPYNNFVPYYNNVNPYYNNVNPYGTQIISPPVIINYPGNTFGTYGNYNYPNFPTNTYSNYNNGAYYQNGNTP